MALQISSAERPALRRVMARFLARLASNRVTLLAAFCAVLFLEQMRSRAGPWAFVLNSSSNLSRSRSWQESREGKCCVVLPSGGPLAAHSSGAPRLSPGAPPRPGDLA